MDVGSASLVHVFVGARASRRRPDSSFSVDGAHTRLANQSHREWLQTAFKRSKRKVEKLVAARHSKPDVPTRVRKLPSPTPNQRESFPDQTAHARSSATSAMRAGMCRVNDRTSPLRPFFNQPGAPPLDIRSRTSRRPAPVLLGKAVGRLIGTLWSVVISARFAALSGSLSP